jgi:hypothetical protein
VCPPVQSGWIGRARRIFAVRRCLLNGSAGGDVLTGLLPATQAERRRRHEPIGQDREGLPARITNPASHPNAFVPVIVGLAKSPSVADDRGAPANRTLPRQEGQRDHPGSMLSFSSGSAIKRITAGVKARPCRSLPKFSICWPGLHPPGKSVSNEKRIQFCGAGREPLTPNIGRFKTTRQELSGDVYMRIGHRWRMWPSPECRASR